MKRKMINKTSAQIAVTKKDGTAFLLASRKSIKVEADNFGELPKGISWKK